MTTLKDKGLLRVQVVCDTCELYDKNGYDIPFAYSVKQLGEIMAEHIGHSLSTVGTLLPVKNSA